MTGVLLLSSALLAKAPDGMEAELAALKTAVKASQSAGDNAWMLVSAALVLMMTGPGLALFYCGLVRKRNVLGTMMQSFAMMAVITLVWAVCGYSLVFSEGNPFIGGLRYLFLQGVGGDPNVIYAPTIPHQTFMIYQLMFAIITPALITGAFAERMRFGAMMLFCTLWTFLVYFPVAHMVWGTGGFLNAYLGGRLPVFDFAGGTVVHITSGFSALITALYIGKRHGYPQEQMMPHSLVLSFIGACLLWVGWFGFNAGSALAASSLATSAFVATHFASAAGAVSWMLVERRKRGKASALGAISGAVAGLATVTQGAGFVQPFSAVLTGFIAGAVCFYMVSAVKERFGYDDSLDVFGVHGIGGMTGTLLAGVFAAGVVSASPALPGGVHGLLEGNPHQVLAQAYGVGVTLVWSGGITFLILKVIGLLVPLRVRHEDEVMGLDVSQHGEALQ
jgi:Amt family ammonium transporter